MGQMNYSAAKAGEHGFTKALAFEGATQGHHRQHHLRPAISRTEMVAACRRAVLETSILPQIPVGRLGESGGDRACRRVPRR